MNKRHILVLVIFFLTELGIGQSNIDSLVNVWTNTNLDKSERANALYQIADSENLIPDSAIAYCEKLYNFSIENNLSVSVVQALTVKGVAYAKMGNSMLAIKNFEDAIEVARKYGYKKKEARISSNMAVVWSSAGNLSKALPIRLKCLKLASETKDTLLLAHSYNGIGITQMNSGKPLKALEFYNKGLYYYQELNNTIGIARVKSNIGLVYFEQKRYDEALLYFKESLSASKKIAHKHGLASVLRNIGHIYEAQDQKQEAEKHFLESLKIFESASEAEGIAIGNLILSDFYLKTEQYEKSTSYALEALDKSKYFLKVEMKASHNLYKLYKMENDNAKSLMMHELHQSLKDSIMSLENIKAIASLELNFEHEKQLLNKKIEFEKGVAEIKVKNQIIVDALIAISVATILTLIVFFRIKAKRREKEKVSLLEELNKLKNEVLLRVRSKNSDQFLKADALDKIRIEEEINASLNKTDWSILLKLYEDPAITNNEIAESVFLSVAGVRSSLKKMYSLFDITEESNNNRRILLVIEAAKLSGSKK